jgi:hypothetical protein
MGRNTGFNHELGRLESGSFLPGISSSEGEWRQNWIANNLSSLEPLAMALAGGALADRLAWVFHAGYQGMMRSAFPFCPKDGWASYLVAEDKTGEFPGAAIKKKGESWTLSGSKSWVAASDHVDYLVVRIMSENSLILLARNDPGVVLSSRDAPGFLADLSQGFATFEQVNLQENQVYSGEILPHNFAQSEPLHVLTALNAFMASYILKHGGDPDILKLALSSLRLAGSLVEEDAVDDTFFLGVADLDTSTSEMAHSFEAFIETANPGLFAEWKKDRGLVNMFSKGLQKKANWLREK